MVSITYKLDEIEKAARLFIENMGNNTVFAFHGSMGVGKTTLIKSICQLLGVEDTINSPTFAIVNEYRSATSELIYHFDFYRINKLEEVYDFGYEDYFFSGAICLIEWAGKVTEILPDDVVNITIEELPDGRRQIMIND